MSETKKCPLYRKIASPDTAFFKKVVSGKAIFDP